MDLFNTCKDCHQLQPNCICPIADKLKQELPPLPETETDLKELLAEAFEPAGGPHLATCGVNQGGPCDCTVAPLPAPDPHQAKPGRRDQDVQPESRAAFRKESAKLTKRALAIVAVLTDQGRPMTDREIKDALGFDEMNSVRPRITELVKDYEILRIVDRMICPTTRNTVRRVGMVGVVYENEKPKGV